MVYDIAQGRMVLFGGWDGTTVRGDTWEWNPATLTWTDISPASGPTARYFHTMAYDKARRRVVLFGGDDGSAVTFFQDTWEWNGKDQTWTNVSPASNPSARGWHSMAYDAARDQVVLFGGYDGLDLLGDTWVWNPGARTWTALTPATSPSIRCEQAMVYDATRERVVLFGGMDFTDALGGDTWEWNGTTWTNVSPAESPLRRHTAGMDYDAARDRLILFGGRNRYINIYYQDTWAYDDTNEVRQGFWTIEECRDAASPNEPCYWHYRYHEGNCPPGQPCAKLVVLFSTGGQTCDAAATFTATEGKGRILQAYAVNDTYIAVCANTFLTAEGTDARPFNEEEERVDQLMLNIADQTGSSPTPQASFMRSLWDGRYLLWSGASHGATAPVVAMGRTALDDQHYWKGGLYTAACFYEGVYDMFYADDFWGRNQCPVQHTRQIGHRYYEGQDVFVHSCSNGKCACAPGHSLEIDEDSLVDTPGDGLTPPLPATADKFAILDWKLIECGSDPLLDRCKEDRLPMETIQALCDLLDADAARTCTFVQFPEKPHDECPDNASTIGACRVWFNNKVEP